jgi:hypothetical protein
MNGHDSNSPTIDSPASGHKRKSSDGQQQQQQQRTKRNRYISIAW